MGPSGAGLSSLSGVFGSLSAQANAATDPIFPLTTQPGLVARPWDLGGFTN